MATQQHQGLTKLGVNVRVVHEKHKNAIMIKVKEGNSCIGP